MILTSPSLLKNNHGAMESTEMIWRNEILERSICREWVVGVAGLPTFVMQTILGCFGLPRGVQGSQSYNPQILTSLIFCALDIGADCFVSMMLGSLC